jgi:hypothetical protein
MSVILWNLELLEIELVYIRLISELSDSVLVYFLFMYPKM